MIATSRPYLRTLTRISRIRTRTGKTNNCIIPSRRYLTTMATSRTIHITPDNTGLGGQKQSEAAAKKVTELLQQDLERHHCYFNDKGYHNHISHQLLSLYGLGASPAELQKGYDDNTSYQRQPYRTHGDEIDGLKDFEKAKEKLGKEEYYTDFLVFFQNEMDKKGWQAVLNEYLFAGDERSDDLLIRMFAGLLHPIIQLMYGIEWQQPAIVAMGLAQAAVHRDDMRTFLTTAEEAAAKLSSSSSSGRQMPDIASLFVDVAANAALAGAARSGDEDKVGDGVLARAFDDMIRVAARVRVEPADLVPRTAEMYNTVVYQAAGAALRPGKEPRFDFFLMHHVNVCPLFVTISAQDWIPTASKVRLLEWKIRFDLLQHASRACPPASLDRIVSYVPKPETRKPISELLPRIFSRHDDGHVSKLIRAIGVCRDVSREYEGRGDWLKLKGGDDDNDVWNKLGQIVMDSVEGEGPRWVSSAGHADSWKEVPDRREEDQERL